MKPHRALDRTLLVTRALVLSLALVAGCSSEEGGTTSNSSAATGCAADGRKDVYAAGMSKPAGALTVKLVEAVPGPPIKGMNVIRLDVRDAAGAPVDGATITVTPFMPDHAHGSARKTVVKPAGGGIYEVTDIWLAMAGLWRLTVTVQANGSTADAVFQFCLDG